jgi:peptidoglycan/xylan/chitin deacetylase (PgdA/CDA1 family)
MGEKHPAGGRIVTASFDDGHPLDLKVAEKLAARGMKATFYVAWNHPKGPEIAAADIRRLRELGMEIGSHTFTHRMLTNRPRNEVVEELRQSRKALEDLLGEPVTSLSYPEGLFNGMIRSTVAECGYRLARTTIAFRTRPPADPTRVPVTIEFIPLGRWAHVRHAGRDGNARGLWSWLRLTRCETDLVRASQLFFDEVLENGGVFHLYARSWQIDQSGLWEAFDRVISHVSRWEQVRYATNADVGSVQARAAMIE